MIEDNIMKPMAEGL